MDAERESDAVDDDAPERACQRLMHTDVLTPPRTGRTDRIILDRLFDVEPVGAHSANSRCFSWVESLRAAKRWP